MVLHTVDVVLRPWRIEDARWHVESRDDEVFKWTSENPALTIRETEEAIQQVNDREDVLGFGIVDFKSKEIMGNVALVLDEQRGCSGEVMYWLAPWGRRRGIASRAVKLVCQWAFDALGLNQVTMKTHIDNLPSQRVAERCGFQRVENTDDREAHPRRLWYLLSNQVNPR